MRNLLLPLVLLCTAGLPAFSKEHAHHPPPADVQTGVAQDAPAQPWLTDAPLRAGMDRIGRSVAVFQHYEHGHMDSEQVVGLATIVEQDIQFLIASCKLEPAADAALHAIIARLSLATQALKADQSDHSAVPSMREALRDYARQFDHPGFNMGSDID